VVVLVRQRQSRLQARASFLHSELLPSALQLHPQLKERLVVGLEKQGGQLSSLSGQLPEQPSLLPLRHSVSVRQRDLEC
jgi:hypothetical protein